MTAADNYYQKALYFYRLGDYEAAKDFCNIMLRSNPENASAFHLLGVVYFKRNNLEQSRINLSKAVKIKYDNYRFHLDLARTLAALNDKNALSHFKKARDLAPHMLQTNYALAMHYKGQDNLKKARKYLEAGLQHKPDHPASINQLGNIFQMDGMLDKALACYEKVLALKPDTAEAHNNIAGIYKLQDKIPDAVREYEKALSLNPSLVSAHYNLGLIHHESKEIHKAEYCYKKAITCLPGYVDALTAYANLLRQTERIEEAIPLYRKVIELSPASETAYYHLGTCFQIRGAATAALQCFDKALALKPDYPEVFSSKAMVLDSRGLHDESVKWHQKAIDAGPPELTQLLYYQFMAKMKIGDWRGYDARLEKIIQRTQAYVNDDDAAYTIPPLIMNIMPVPLDLRRKVVEKYTAIQENSLKAVIDGASFLHKKEPPEKLHIGYMSPDFKSHAVGGLIQDIFALHDKNKFKISAYSLVNTKDSVQEKIKNGCDVYKEVFLLSSEQIARMIHEDNVHILIDLAGYTTFSRPGVFCFHPAPVQAHYLGYLDTIGNQKIRYILTDVFAVPPDMAAGFTETPVYLPDTFAVCSDQEISKKPFTRKECGLPEDHFVFCCMNSPHKIEPGVFDSWMRILSNTDKSVLWLYDGGSRHFAESLRNEAEKRGVSPDRIIFAGKLPGDEYLARYCLADLFLDTFVYNAGATLISTLQAGCPALTLPGNTLLSRMGGSICQGAGLGGLVCNTKEEYEAKAIGLCMDKTVYHKMKDDWLSSQSSAPLFDTKGFVKKLETAYQKMWNAYLNDESPEIIYS